MKRLSRHLAAASVACAAFAAQPALAQGADGSGLSHDQTNRVVTILDTGFRTCLKVEPVYRIDCFSQVYRNGSKLLANNASYWEAEVALTRVGRNLYSFQRANTDSSKGRVRTDGYRLKAVTPASMPEAEALYATNVSRAEELLRSGNKAEQTFFGPIADEVAKFPELVP
ncbi:hypothetical protein [Shimia sp. SDUM112013]|uniref:hypothetical protein n=1 Tax=Shimia sp. SDUM112013 TaxID=3136160 RepID=UPI0032EFC654